MGKWTGESLIPPRLTDDPSPPWIGGTCRRALNSNGYLLFRSDLISWTFVVILPSEPEHVVTEYFLFKISAHRLLLQGQKKNGHLVREAVPIRHARTRDFTTGSTSCGSRNTATRCPKG